MKINRAKTTPFQNTDKDVICLNCGAEFSAGWDDVLCEDCNLELTAATEFRRCCVCHREFVANVICQEELCQTCQSDEDWRLHGEPATCLLCGAHFMAHSNEEWLRQICGCDDHHVSLHGDHQ
jgi:hypothetical protein